MDKEMLKNAANPKHLSKAAYEGFSSQDLKPSRDESPASHSVREAEYNGRKIRIETTYHITVDGEPVMGHVMVGNNGRVHYHSIPNQEFKSAIDMAKRLIDLMPPAADSWYGEEED